MECTLSGQIIYKEAMSMEIGAQFYTVRSMAQTAEGMAETFSKVADIGYRTAQLSATCPYDTEWMKEQLHRHGLRCVRTPYLCCPADR